MFKSSIPCFKNDEVIIKNSVFESLIFRLFLTIQIRCPTQNKQISLPQIILTQSRRQITSITTIPPLQYPHTRHTPSLQMHTLTHHIVTPGFVDRLRWSDGVAGQMERYASWWTKRSGMIGLRPQTRVKGVGRHNNNNDFTLPGYNMYFQPAIFSTHGGLITYIKSSLNSTLHSNTVYEHSTT